MTLQTKPQWIIFDIGGVLFDTQKAIQTIAEYAGVRPEDVQSRFTEATIEQGELGEIGFTEAWVDVLRSLDREVDEETLFSLWVQPIHFVPDTLALAQDLQSHGYHLATLTNSWKGVMQRDEQVEPLNVLFSTIIDSSEVGLRKPHPEIFTYAETLLGTKGENIFYIDDILDNITVGQQFGWQTYHYDLTPDEGKTANKSLRSLLIS